MNPTAWILVAAAGMLVAWDVYAAARWGYPGTISYDVLAAAREYPVIALAAGVVMGHLFWPQ